MMHELQQKLLKIAEQKNLGEYTLREIAKMLGETSAQKVKHHLQQLEKRGLIKINKMKGLIEKSQAGFIESIGLKQKSKLFAIPILGAASAGPAMAFAEGNIEGFLRISSSLFQRQTMHNMFALKVDGSSMNKAVVDGKKIEDGDYVIIDHDYKDPKDGDIVLSIIDGVANIKRFYKDEEGNVVLASDSSQHYPPIYIHRDDNYMVSGRVVKVIKKPRFK